MAKDYREKDHQYDWLNYGPQNASRRLFVPNFDVSPDKKVNEFSVFPELG